jgi:hypothetical protein
MAHKHFLAGRKCDASIQHIVNIILGMAIILEAAQGGADGNMGQAPAEPWPSFERATGPIPQDVSVVAPTLHGKPPATQGVSARVSGFAVIIKARYTF